MADGRVREPCKAMGHDGREMERDCGGRYCTTSQMVVVVEKSWKKDRYQAGFLAVLGSFSPRGA